MASKLKGSSSSFHWTSPLTPTHLLHLLRSERDTLSALRLFDSATASGLRPDSAAVSLLSSRLASSGHFSRAYSLLCQHPSAPLHAFLSLLRSLGGAHRPLSALRLFRLAPKSLSLPHCVNSYNTVLSVLVSNGRIPLAVSLFDEMRKEEILPTVGTYNVMLKALCVMGSLDKGMKLFRTMAERDVCSYNTLIDGMCRNGRLSEARELFDEMLERNVVPTVVTYTTLLHWLLKSGDLDDALEVFAEMDQRGLLPNVVTYSSFIDGLCKNGESIKAVELLNRMIKERIMPNAIIYSSIINGLCKEDKLNEAIEIFDRMRLQGKKPDTGLFSKIIIGLCNSGRAKESANYLDELVISNISPNRVTWSLHVKIHNMVILGLCEKRELARAFQVYQSTRTRGISVEPTTFKILVEYLCSKRDNERASRVVFDMLTERCLPEKETWNDLISVYWKKKKVKEEAERILSHLIC
ncbi:hypothetical protein LUZ60_008115 [Juncus effusus]|nr:hypothetical protein LUZ60_008115 [Juncus effusus]